ncbi:Multidrug export protein MepA [Vibrio ruber DSM 16370]|uniref:Multidrug resistance protein NorM n=1 Tax=Vibrio ruber (strain DSM 16370 / JCM 11486 / BCRC 17186 / CECT 7878 / LMG 23124 / VR1) TaxID=1123498 RepID=A0A1R4LLY6_VIBR1|nr:MATE family efflux transporter [Vibrio ruber]SJN57439.1 Multidrug export protein MepA [Vibrio ruber DSM 16370]
MHDKHGLLSAPIPVVLRRMTIPMTFGMISVLMFNLIDTYFISLLGTQALAAVSYTFPVTFAVNCITMGIGIGLSTSIGHLLGQKSMHNAARLTIHGLLLAVVLVTIASGIGLLTITPLFTLLGAQQTLLPLIQQYMSVWYIAVPLLVIPMAGNSAIRATGDTRTPALLMIISGAINGILDPLLIFGYGPFPKLGIQGAAIASAISWSTVLVGTFYILFYRERLVTRPYWRALWPDWKQILQIGTPAALSNAMTPLSGALLMILLSQHGTVAVAAYGAAQRVESLLILVLMSLTSTLTPFLAQNFGADNPQRGFAGLFLSIRFSVVFQGIIFLMMVPLSIPISALFSQETQVREILWHYLLIVPLSYGFQGIVMMIVSALNALHQPLKAFSWNFMRLFIFILPSAWIGSQLWQVNGLFVGIAIGNILSGICGYFQALSLRRQTLYFSNSKNTGNQKDDQEKEVNEP